MIKLLYAHDPGIVELETPSGGVLATPGLQGRIFCHLGGRLVHRLDVDLLEKPSPHEFNNLGGNSLWAAPEGGPYAFHYPPDGGPWYVQKAIGWANLTVTERTATSVTMDKDISLTNRKGLQIALNYRRAVTVLDPASYTHGHDLKAIRYRIEDTFSPRGDYSADDVLIAPWSLEQFPGAEGITAFGKVSDPQTCVNPDFYGSPMDRIAYGPDHFTFRLGGQDRHQIGVRVANNPRFIGAFDSARGFVMLRRAAAQPGLYFNIADNEQPRGPYSAADLYSIFNGGALDFFELETIGAMQVKDVPGVPADGMVAPSTLVSESVILEGPHDELGRFLESNVFSASHKDKPSS